MLISHEVPNCLLNKSRKFNDYDYCLLHLLLQNKKYRDYYIKASKKGRKILLDNSIFELGESLNNDDIIKGIEMINPEWVVAPDSLNNADKTIANFKKFVAKVRYSLPKNKVKIIGVVQGSTMEDMIRCYIFMSRYADKIAIPFRSKVYEKYHLGFDGRIVFINYLKSTNIWNYNKPHHLLGCYLIKEFCNYDFETLNIESLDTSNPIIAGINNVKYSYKGLDYKPKEKLCDLINIKLTLNQKRKIKYNINKFRKIINRQY